MLQRVSPILALLAATVGCSSIESDDLETSGMTPSIEVRAKADGSATDVFASINAGAALTTVDLDGEDVLSASAGDVTVELSESNLLGVVTYAGSLAGISEPGTEVTVSLARSADKESAPNSVVRLPVKVDITAPAAGAEFSRADDDIVVDIASEASDDDLRLSWSGECVDGGGLDVPSGQASVTINKGSIVKREQVDANDPDSRPVPDTCTITITVSRTIIGALDPVFGGGEIRSVSSGSRDVTSNS